mgnify:CR=1 FL=1
MIYRSARTGSLLVVVLAAIGLGAEEIKEFLPAGGCIEIGGYNPVLGKSYREIAGESRSMHASQGMGSSQPKGEASARRTR